VSKELPPDWGNGYIYWNWEIRWHALRTPRLSDLEKGTAEVRAKLGIAAMVDPDSGAATAAVDWSL